MAYVAKNDNQPTVRNIQTHFKWASTNAAQGVLKALHKAGLGLRDIGLVTGAPAYASKEVQEAYDLAGQIGVSGRSRILKKMRAAQDDYFSAKTASQKDAAAKKWRKVAKATMPALRKEESKRRKEAREK